tara:strand:- start:1110 stop:1634 length:525 start_codon:yes stop_codon:yes gene_type:complete
MKKTFKYLIFIISFFFSNIALSNDSIYYIDMDFIMNNSLAGKSIVKQLTDKKKNDVENFKKTEINLKKEETKIVSQKNILDKKEFDQKVVIFNQKLDKYKNDRLVAQETFSKNRSEAQKNLMNIITPLLADYSKKNKISYILPKQNIIIGKTELDLTSVIVTILNDKTKSIKIK